MKPLRLSSPVPSSSSPNLKPVAPQDEIKFFAFKAIPRDVVLHGRELSSVSGGGRGEGDEDDEKTCKEVVNGITEKVKVLCGEAGSGWDTPGEGDKGKFLKEEDIISLEEAREGVRWSERLEHGVKRWLWL